ncbi:ankyrin repeat domain-containing protein 54-like [Planococcus citri]|uniref:ankyrin repeat domain-containing protein 54-like n=1 Tax=Planococcus citri TaxID=170843 RepID=UPI0031FA284D
MDNDEVKNCDIVFPLPSTSRISSQASDLDNSSREDRFSFLRKYPNITSPVYELHDFTGKIRAKRFPNRFKLSLSSIDEVVYQDIGTLVLKSNQVRHLCKAVLTNQLGFVSTLLDHGVSPNCFDEHRRSPLHLAVSKGYCEMVQLLLDRGADPNIKDGLGNSCLHLAACTNNVEMAFALIKGGASVDAVDIRGRSPVQLAQSKLRILQQSPNESIKSKVTQIIDMLLLYLEKGSKTQVKNDEAEFLSNFHNRLQISNTPEKLSSEIDSLRKMLDQMETLSLS